MTGDDDGGAAVQPELGELCRLGVRGERRDREAGGASERGQAFDDGSAADEHELGLREIRLHVDLQRATAVARHAVFEEALRTARRSAGLAVEPEEAGPAVAERAEGLAHHHRIGAGTTDPSLHAAVLANEHLRAGLRRGRRFAANDRRQRERFSATLQLGSERQELFAHRGRTPFNLSRLFRGGASTPSPA